MKLPTAFQKKDGNWYCHYNGKQHYLGKNPEEKIRRLVAADNIKTSKLNLSDVAAQYLSWIEPTQSPDSIDGKRRVYRRLVNDIGDIPIHDLSLDRLEAYRNSLLKKVKKITVRTTFIKISALLQFCVERHIVEGGVRYVKRNALAGRSEELVTFEDYQRLAALSSL